MGVGVAQNVTEHGHEAVLIDVSKEALDAASCEIARYARFGHLLGSTAEHRGDMADRVTYATDVEALHDVDFLVENITESWTLKSELYPRLDEVCPQEAVFAVNTSCIPITKVAARTNRPDRVLGIHFMNPVPMKPTVELIKGWHTGQAAIDTTLAVLASIGKDAVVVEDSPGFVSNRVLMLTVNEAAWVVHDRVATAADVDEIFTRCFGHEMGPLATADLIGLDTILYSVQVLHEEFGDSKYRPCPLLTRMVDAGLLGRKSGRGFHQYA
jgi:3-hydroxybutyryl-CoA dehydrogenase